MVANVNNPPERAPHVSYTKIICTIYLVKLSMIVVANPKVF